MILVESGIIPNLQSIGFVCGDPKINFKYNGDTVEPHILLLVTLIVPYLMVSQNDRICNICHKYNVNNNHYNNIFNKLRNKFD